MPSRTKRLMQPRFRDLAALDNVGEGAELDELPVEGLLLGYEDSRNGQPLPELYGSRKADALD
jgi:hypothetical protein